MIGIKAPLLVVFVCLWLATVSWHHAPLWACWFSFSVGAFVLFTGQIWWDEQKSKSLSLSQLRKIIHFSVKEFRFKPQIPSDLGFLFLQGVDTNASHKGISNIFYCVRPTLTPSEPFRCLIVAIRKAELHQLQRTKQLLDLIHDGTTHDRWSDRGG